MYGSDESSEATMHLISGRLSFDSSCKLSYLANASRTRITLPWSVAKCEAAWLAKGFTTWYSHTMLRLKCLNEGHGEQLGRPSAGLTQQEKVGVIWLIRYALNQGFKIMWDRVVLVFLWNGMQCHPDAWDRGCSRMSQLWC